MTVESEYQTGIVGAGWLGLPLAKVLQVQGQSVAVTVSSSEKAARLVAEGMPAWPLQLSAQLDALPFHCRELVVCVPPSKTEDYPAAVARLCQLARTAGTQRVLFISATSVWAPGQGEDEAPQPAHARGMRMLAAEQGVLGAGFECAMVLRPAGLYGPDRHPGRFLAGKTLAGGAQAVNLVHLDDVVAACLLMLAQGQDGDAYNLSAPVHPRREQLYPFASRLLGLAPPIFTEPSGDFAPIEGQRICQRLGFVYRWPDPAHWFAEQAAQSD
ncbi:NAD-dependent epimerase/dehydratase family protein [Aeromonas sp. MR16]|uniref:NAD-dependent epimerase/dehydratase family protein n=1 Tax=Aeromonas sp. MR16 TaxID=2923420 RepID=UPI001F4A5C47|nr:NAD-dependent epimerase/dehydratase family protein [Aeromonas sp. MR16]MCH7370587.1 NAD-dependent epimerase/dehydratase family protein [Aeromonas sp. MR16]